MTRLEEIKDHAKRLRLALRDIVTWAEGSTCEICGKKKMTEREAIKAIQSFRLWKPQSGE